MGYWKCTECGGKRFNEKVIDGSQCVEYDKNGNLIDYWDLELKMGNTICNKCGSNSKNIQDIAEWVDED